MRNRRICGQIVCAQFDRVQTATQSKPRTSPQACPLALQSPPAHGPETRRRISIQRPFWPLSSSIDIVVVTRPGRGPRQSPPAHPSASSPHPTADPPAPLHHHHHRQHHHRRLRLWRLGARVGRRRRVVVVASWRTCSAPAIGPEDKTATTTDQMGDESNGQAQVIADGKADIRETARSLRYKRSGTSKRRRRKSSTRLIIIRRFKHADRRAQSKRQARAGLEGLAHGCGASHPAAPLLPELPHQHRRSLATPDPTAKAGGWWWL